MNRPIRVLDMIAPRIKPELSPYVTADGAVRIGATVFGLGIEIADPGGKIKATIAALDGTRSPAEILGLELVNASSREIAAIMQQLLDAGVLEDSSAPIPGEVTDRDRERYARGVPLFRWLDQQPRRSSWDIQAILRRSRVLLIGVGGVGGTVAQGLVASGVGLLRLVDHDLVELSNLNRQTLYREKDIGRLKVDAAIEHLGDINSDVEISGDRLSISSEADLSDIFEPGYDLVLLCADEPHEIRRWANRACHRAGVAWIVGGYYGPIVSVGMHRRGAGACWECLHDQAIEAPEMRFPPGFSHDDLDPQFDWHPANAVSAGITGMFMAYFALAALTGAPPVSPGFWHEVNLAHSGESSVIRFDARDGCETCGTQF